MMPSTENSDAIKRQAWQFVRTFVRTSFSNSQHPTSLVGSWAFQGRALASFSSSYLQATP
jgi:hypothetical protein